MRPLLIRASQGSPPALAVAALMVPAPFLLAWGTSATAGLLLALLKAASLPGLWLDRRSRRTKASPRFQPAP